MHNHFELGETSLETNSGVTLLANDNNIDQSIIQILRNIIVDVKLEDLRMFNKAVYKNILYTTTCYQRAKKLLIDFLKILLVTSLKYLQLFYINLNLIF